MPTPKKKSASAVKTEKKLLIVHKRALEEKYKKSGYSKVEASLKKLIKADSDHNIETKIAFLDTKVPTGGTAAATARNSGKFKSAVDDLYKSEQFPDYLVLVGGPDVIPHIPLRSPWGNKKPRGEDEFVDSDLPYASDHPHTLDPSKFSNAPRMVGRIPDVPGASDPTYLVDRIKEAHSAPALNAQKHFSLSAQAWQGATQEIINRVFGGNAKLHCCPALGPTWTSSILKKPFHFINCHGDTRKAVFYGEQAGMAGPLPHAINTSTLAKKVVPGAVVVAECCYGAELFAPMLPHQPQGMAYSYLEQGATTFLGSSTISYGGAEAADLTCADDLCLFFLEGLLQGESCGRALSDARRRMVEGQTEIGNHEVKTLAQFMLLGDPSRRPVKVAKKMVAKKVAKAIFEKGAAEIQSSLRITIPLRKASTSSVANKAVEGDPAKRLPLVPIPSGQIFDATFYTSSKSASATKTMRLMAKAARKSRIRTTIDETSPQSGILEVYIPNDPALIAAMRDTWDQAQQQSQATMRGIRPKAVRDVREFETSGSLWTTASEPASLPLAFPEPSEDVRLLLTPALPLIQIGSSYPQIPAEPERNRRAVLVARVVNGQIKSYKVIVAR